MKFCTKLSTAAVDLAVSIMFLSCRLPLYSVNVIHRLQPCGIIPFIRRPHTNSTHYVFCVYSIKYRYMCLRHVLKSQYFSRRIWNGGGPRSRIIGTHIQPTQIYAKRSKQTDNTKRKKNNWPKHNRPSYTIYTPLHALYKNTAFAINVH